MTDKNLSNGKVKLSDSDLIGNIFMAAGHEVLHPLDTFAWLDEGMDEGDGAASGKYLPTNAWAWKALGVVDLIRRNYAESIKAFQVALRADVDDQLPWLRLGEACSKAGRGVAALRTLGRAHELRPDD
ncbi:uncharacterized protein EDB93DRAFT_1268447 [Suillus bovinus]|uniref:uncharacterized protein n=1 Tax=Suillus bovinus TaxID=48563 RepID=UPI001B86A1FE|nr:uncharacterized protein EDB93DRAFT_1268447 [Suillus bovinus]KAG2128352.1 hypothetical protein EDB93DRAFT_1268447 [Suillus bovinus]